MTNSNYTSLDVVLVQFPYTDLETTKKRPALILRSFSFAKESRFYIIAMITSKVDSLKLEGDIILTEWQNSGLLHPSLIRLAKIATIEESLIERKIGVIHGSDAKNVKSSFFKLFSLLKP